ncbi:MULTISPECIES: chalcone isomerase family protein [Alcanivorax]|nr:MULTISPECIES: chalcone isomerase family protein [Alcanivorax]
MAKTPFPRRLKGAPPLALILGLMSQASAQTAWQECSRADVKALKVFTVGEASLSRMNCDDTDPLSPPLKLEFAYFREVPGDAFAKAALHFLEKNLPQNRFDTLKPRFASFNSHYQNVDDGDTYTLVWMEQDFELRLNNTPLAKEQGADFARDYLKIWFGQAPYSKAMKAELLGEP